MKSVAEIVLERICQGAATATAEGNVTYANERLAGMAGVPRACILGMPLADLVRSDPDRRRIQALASAGRRGSAQCRVTMGRAARSVLVSAAPLNGEIICLFSDLTELARRESADAALREFIGGLGQELTATIAPILEAISALKASGRIDEGTRLELAAIESAVDRLRHRAENLKRAESPAPQGEEKRPSALRR